MKILGNYRFLGGLMGGEAPPMPKNGHFKAEGLFLGWVGKSRKINSFRIIGQNKINSAKSFKIFVWMK
jgi:hypothetical protein